MYRRFYRSDRRTGLAPLELVLAIPFLLGIMALMVNIGNLACWKVRASTVARQRLWGNLSPRLMDGKTGNRNPLPDYWPSLQSNAGIQDQGNLSASVDDLRVKHPVVRGPIFLGMTVNSDLLDPSLTLRTGFADKTQEWPMLKNLGRFRLNAHTSILDGSWRCTEMGIGNTTCRLDLIYLAFRAPSANNPVYTAMMVIYKAIQSGQMALLYGTESDYRRFQTAYGQSPPQYVGSIPGWTRLFFQCSSSPTVVESSVNNLIERIQGSKRNVGPMRNLASALIAYYRQVQDRIQTLMNAQPPPSASQIAQMQKDLKVLDTYIEQLRQFITSL